MLSSRHLGYFVLHTIKPLIEELDSLMGKCENLKFDKLYVEYILRQLIDLEITKAIIYAVAYTLIAGFLCIAIWLTLLFL